jgi:hypothetical protein
VASGPYGDPDERPGEPQPGFAPGGYPPPTYPTQPGGYRATQPPYAGTPAAYPPNGYGGNPYAVTPGAGYTRPRNGLGIAALVLGIVGTALFWTFWIGFGCGVLAVIFGAVGLSHVHRGEAANRGQAKAGLILGIIALIAPILFWILMVAVWSAAVTGFGTGVSA